MKLSILFLCFLTTGAFAAADRADIKDLATKLSVSNTCARQVLLKVTQQCNQDSHNFEGRDRDHSCWYQYMLSTRVHQGIADVTFTTGDADEWSYTVTITDEADGNDCSFDIKKDEN